jgi:hypothetical protein
MCATYRDKQKRSHFESFANKIFTGIREIKPNYAEKRAVWELFQNALDTVDKNGIIEIAKTTKGLLFAHNGRPFTDDEFGGLIKQFSVGKAYGDNTEKVGQYGTGFISTHVYGKKITVNGSLKMDDGSYRMLRDFVLDRDAESIDKLTDKLLDQDQIIDALCENNLQTVTTPLPFTSFEYVGNPGSYLHIDAMLVYIKTILPFIFCFNDKLDEVKLSLGDTEDLYKRVEGEQGSVHLTINDQPLDIPFLENDDHSVKVILGSAASNLKEIPKRFLYYPLMETAPAGTNFIIHANDFKPNKERDFLHQAKDNQELKLDVEKNETLLKSAFDTVLKKVGDDDSLLLLDIADIQFVENDSLYEIALKSNFIIKIQNLERIEIENEKYAIESFEYFDASILLLDEETITAVYNVFKQFRTLPPLKQYCRLSELVNNWNEHIEVKFTTLTIADFGKKIAEVAGGDYYYIKDKVSYQLLIAEISKEITLLNQSALIPNIHGRFKLVKDLFKWEPDEPSLIQVVDAINASTSEKYIHNDFEFLANVNAYDREQFKDDFSKFCNELVDSISKAKDDITSDSVRFAMLIESLNIFVGFNKKTLLNKEVAAFYERVYALPILGLEILDPTDTKINYQPAIKLLAHLYIKGLQKEKIEDHLIDLKEIIDSMFKNSNLKEELLHKMACIPDQNLILKSQAELKKDEVLDAVFKDRCDAITGKKCRDELAYDGFHVFLQHPGIVSGGQLGGEIESSLNSNKDFIPVDKLTIDTVLGLIEKISEKPSTWGQWLPNINRVKEEVLMHKFQNEKTRSSLFAILTKDEKKIELLGELAKVTDLEDLVKKGKEKQLEENRKNNHLIYINYIGLKIQEIIRLQLDIELADVVSVMKSEEDSTLITQEEQNGQDFIIYKNDKPIYYLEVKSKWDENGRFALSKNQTERCAEELNRYAVISVNVDRYKRKNGNDNEIIPFEQLKEFVRVNDDLGPYFKKLVSENITKTELNDPKLIEYRGSIPQKLIDENGFEFDHFILALITKLKQPVIA